MPIRARSDRRNDGPLGGLEVADGAAQERDRPGPAGGQDVQLVGEVGPQRPDPQPRIDGDEPAQADRSASSLTSSAT